MKDKFTRGPWTHVLAKFNKYEIWQSDPKNFDDGFPTKAAIIPYTDDEGLANAKLIAAAPQLLEALLGLSHLMTGREDWPEVIRAKEVIKKATE